MTQTIVSHVAPDWDAITSLWQLQRFGGFADAEIRLVNTGNPDPAVLATAAAVVDTGHGPFDHHQLADPNSTCAAMLVYEWLCQTQDLVYLRPLIDLVYAGDTGKPAANQSRETGIHAQLSAWKARGILDDAALIARGYDVLDDLAEHLLRGHEARRTLEQHTVYRSADGLLVALDRAPQGVTQAAFEAGAQLVVWHNPMESTVAVGINRAPESGIDCGALVGLAAPYVDIGDLFDELMSWYRHPSGFFAGRGSPKAPDARPLAVPVAEIAQALDAVWRR